MRKAICVCQIVICVSIMSMQMSELCASCSAGHEKFILAAVGLLFYASMLAFRSVEAVLPLALIAHTALVAFFPPCALCIVSYSLLLLLNVFCKRVSIPAACIAALALSIIARIAIPDPAPEIGLVAYLKNDCPYCQKFEFEYAPRLREKGVSIVMKRFPEVPGWVERFPTIVCYNRKQTPAIFSGLPEFEQIQEAFK